MPADGVRSARPAAEVPHPATAVHDERGELVAVADEGGFEGEVVDPPTRIVRVDVDWRSVLVVAAAGVAVLVLVSIAAAAPGALQIMVLASILALAANPVVARLQQLTRLGRTSTVALLCGTGLLAVGLLIGLFGPATVEQARSFQQDLPRVVDQLDTLPIVGPILVRNNVPQQVEQWLSQLPKQLAGKTAEITGAAEAITAGLIQALVVFLVMLALLIDGPRLGERARVLIPVRRRAMVARLGGAAYRVVGRSFAGSLVLAFLQGMQVLLTGLILGVPLSPLLALWAGLWNLVPQIGGAVGGITFVLVAFTVSPTAGIIAGVVFFAYMMFSNNVLLPVIVGRATDISPFTTMVAAVAGFAIGGILGAILAIPFIGAGKAMYRELRDPGWMERQDAGRGPRPARRLLRRLRGVRHRAAGGDDGDAEADVPSTAGPAAPA